MTVSELINTLKKIPNQNLEVRINGDKLCYILDANEYNLRTEGIDHYLDLQSEGL